MKQIQNQTLYWALIIGGAILIALYINGIGISIRELITGNRPTQPIYRMSPRGGLVPITRNVDFIPPMVCGPDTGSLPNLLKCMPTVNV
jgi:hypothetical protein